MRKEKKMKPRKFWLIVVFTALALAVWSVGPALAAKKPNIVVIWGDDIGWFNISAYNHGMMGYKTPNIDRIAGEGVLFTDAYAQQSCTAGRAAFITGQSPIRTGLLTIDMPGAELGLDQKDPTIPGMLKEHGYMTAQFGKNHLGDLDKHLPTAHGFDVFYGNLYHLNAEEEPENEDYPKNPEFRKKFGPRGIISATADGKIEDTGPLTSERMKTADEEFLGRSLDFIVEATKADKPFFLWFTPSRMHIWTHLKDEAKGVTGQGIYADGMVEHDGHIGQILDKLDKLGIAENTIVVYSTDNGAEVWSWPDGGTIPFRGEKNSNWEGGYRVPLVMRWPAKIPAGQVVNDIISHEDWATTLLAAAGDTDVKEKLKKGATYNGRQYKVHLDGYNWLPYLTGQAEKGPREDFFYWNDDGSLVGLRFRDWKMVFMEQRGHGFDTWVEMWEILRIPKIFNLRRDPFERADHESNYYHDWWVNRAYMFVPAQAYVLKYLKTFAEFPRRAKPATFGLDQVMDQLEKNSMQ
jgi:arylsulfatase